MKKDSVVTVTGGQSLRLKKIKHYLDPLVFTYRKEAPNNEELSFEFSLDDVKDWVNDSIKRHQNSGFYCMTVEQRSANTDRFLAIR